MNVLVACEESQTVCTAFREKGHNAFSADILKPSGKHYDWHIQGDVLQILNPVNGDIRFHTMDGKTHIIKRWDLIIAHPPCTYLCLSGQQHCNIDKYGDKAKERIKKRDDAIKFLWNL